MSSDTEQRAMRAAERRRTWQGRKAILEELPEVEVVGGTPAERIALVTELTLTAWALRGTPIPEYDRATMPGRVIRSGATADG